MGGGGRKELLTWVGGKEGVNEVGGGEGAAEVGGRKELLRWGVGRSY